MLPVEWENANIPALLRPLILEAQVGFCYTLLFEPLAYCSHFHHRITTESFTIDSPVDIPVSDPEDLETSVKFEQLGMHLSLSVVVSILSDGVDDTREDLLVAFLLPRDLFVDMYELEVHYYNKEILNKVFKCLTATSSFRYSMILTGEKLISTQSGSTWTQNL